MHNVIGISHLVINMLLNCFLGWEAKQFFANIKNQLKKIIKWKALQKQNEYPFNLIKINKWQKAHVTFTAKNNKK